MANIAVIGFGAATIGYIEKIKNSNHNITIFERSKDVVSSSLSGIRSDGKIFVSKDMGGKLDIDLDIQRNVVNFYIEKSQLPSKDIEYGYSFKNENSEFYKKFYLEGFTPVNSEFFHIGTDFLKNVMKNIFNDFKSYKNINFNFNSKVFKIEPTPDGGEVFWEERADNRELILKNQNFDHIVIGVGRSGHKLVESMKKNYKKISLSSTTVDLGVRFELPNHIVEQLNSEMYEFKVLQKMKKTGYWVRTFCNNPSGYVTTERYNNNEFVTVNGHSKVKSKTENTNFAILVTHKFTEPFNDPVGYGTYISKLSNILAGGKKVILQKYEDFKIGKRTKYLGRVKPTLDSKHFILGDLNLVFPAKTRESIIDFIENLDKVVPGIGCPDNLIYGVEVKFYSNILDNNYFDNIKFIGDCSGWTRSITYATSHGIIQAEKDLKILEK